VNRSNVLYQVSQSFPTVRGTIYVTYNTPPLQVDACGVCGGNNSTCIDCAGVLFGKAVLDKCRICSGGTTGKKPGSTLDCAGVCSGTARNDSCGVCSGGSTGREADANKDCFGVCFGNGTKLCGQCFNLTDTNPLDDLSIALGKSFSFPLPCLT
jgi:hypothetical protein